MQLCDWHYYGVRVEKPREIAVRVLRGSGAGKGRLETVFDQELARAALSPPDRALARELVFGIVRWQATLDWVIARKTQGRTQKPLLQVLLRLGLYQAFWLDRIPDHAVVNETVQLARELGCGPQSGFVNALLRECLRERPAIERELSDLKTREPALGFSHPEWLCARWQKRWGSERLQALLEWNNRPAPVYARVNTLRANSTGLAAKFTQEAVDAVPRSFGWCPSDLVFELRSHPPLASLPSFQEGLFYVQDPSTLLAVRELDPRPDERILDLCAAPGGKSTFIAQLLANRGIIVAEDMDPLRLERLRENCARLGVTCVQPAQSSAASADSARASFDRILVDAPCSNTGVMRRRVELRWRIQPQEIARLQAVQVELLRAVAPRLQAGGVLVYSTCSLEPEENRDVVNRFLEQTPGFQLEREQELVPFADGVDGAYVARLRGVSPG